MPIRQLKHETETPADPENKKGNFGSLLSVPTSAHRSLESPPHRLEARCHGPHRLVVSQLFVGSCNEGFMASFGT